MSFRRHELRAFLALALLHRSYTAAAYWQRLIDEMEAS